MEKNDTFQRLRRTAGITKEVVREVSGEARLAANGLRNRVGEARLTYERHRLAEATDALRQRSGEETWQLADGATLTFMHKGRAKLWALSKPTISGGRLEKQLSENAKGLCFRSWEVNSIGDRADERTYDTSLPLPPFRITRAEVREELRNLADCVNSIEATSSYLLSGESAAD